MTSPFTQPLVGSLSTGTPTCSHPSPPHPCPGLPLDLQDTDGPGALQKPCFQMRPRDSQSFAQVTHLASVKSASNARSQGLMVALPNWGQSHNAGRQKQDLSVLESSLLPS